MRALFIVDVQKGFACEKAAHLPDLIEKLQPQFDRVLAAQFINPQSSPWREIMDWHECGAGSPETSLAFDLRKDAVLLKHKTYAVPMDDIREALNGTGIKDIYICGADTHACVLMNAVAIFESGDFKPFVITDACASHSGNELHKAGLKALEGLVGQQQLIKINDIRI